MINNYTTIDLSSQEVSIVLHFRPLAVEPEEALIKLINKGVLVAEGLSDYSDYSSPAGYFSASLKRRS